LGATQSGFGRTGTVDWDTSIHTGTVTAATGKGYFVNTTSGGITVNLPAAAVGSIVAVSDYASTAASNNIIVAPNGSEKINGVNDNYTISTAGLAVTLVYADATKGWKSVTGSDADATGVIPAFVTATGGTPCAGATCGDYKIHTFTGPGTLTVSCAGNAGGSNTVDYLVVAGGAGGAGAEAQGGGGGGGGGFRTSASTYSGPPLAVACGVTVTASPYSIAVGGGGAGGAGGVCNPGIVGVASSGLCITSAGGGGGGPASAPSTGGDGGSGGGGGEASASGGTGNTPPVSPAQGTNGSGGDPGSPPNPRGSGAGGGATEAGVQGAPTVSGRGGAGAPNAITGSAVSYAGGGGGGIKDGTAGAASPCGTGGAGKPIPASSSNPGTLNRGGGGGGSGGSGPVSPCGVCIAGGNGGSGVVIIRYKFQ